MKQAIMETNSFTAGSQLRAWMNTQQSQGRDYSIGSILAVLKDHAAGNNELLPLFSAIAQNPAFSNLYDQSLSLSNSDATKSSLLANLKKLYSATAIAEARLFLDGFIGTVNDINSTTNITISPGVELSQNNQAQEGHANDSTETPPVNGNTPNAPLDNRRDSNIPATRIIAVWVFIAISGLVLGSYITNQHINPNQETDPNQTAEGAYKNSLTHYGLGHTSLACSQLNIARSLGYNKQVHYDLINACKR